MGPGLRQIVSGSHPGKAVEVLNQVRRVGVAVGLGKLPPRYPGRAPAVIEHPVKVNDLLVALRSEANAPPE